MKEIVKVVIPSHKRWDRVATICAVDKAILCVEEAQKVAYEACNPNVEIVCHPNEIKGLAAKRDWIIGHFGSVFMLDDDIESLKRVYTEKGEETEIDPETAYDIIQCTALACKAAGFFGFGFSTSPTPLHFDSLNPIRLTGYLTGCAHGVLKGSKLWYSPDIVCNEDYWISCLNAYHHRGVYKDLRFYWQQRETFVNRGGLAEFRNTEAEEADFKLLQTVFGKDVVSLRKNQKRMKHPFQKHFKTPF
ncbi:hypothetical protein LAG90_15675 [Marinilongibacter aquaticus]|uniref:GREB1-related protein n=1 Tax=Marinilongibacter aquaticus TaxID=2975157 RepID=UPI0021BDBA40|nr:hypothetical protein [Marinilongibacter aquaticus]UBM58243.1 hypothetical protein LAG90_15675 [Marinilongibacter aquaticus]